MHNFEHGKIKATLIEVTPTSLLDVARYLFRLSVAMARTSEKTPSMAFVPEFAMILAHTKNAVNFPFDIPSPLAHPADVMDAWNIYLDSDPALWDALIAAIEAGLSAAPKVDSHTIYYKEALAEYVRLSKQGRIPPPRHN